MTDVYSFPTDTDPDPDNIPNFAARRAQVQSQLALGDSPDDASRAMDLGRATGIPAPVVHSDLENTDQAYKAKLVSGIVENNPFIRDYINAHPLAASVSNDDYGQLDAASASLKKISPVVGNLWAPNAPLISVLQKGIEGFKDNFGKEELDAETLQLTKLLRQNGVTNSVAEALSGEARDFVGIMKLFSGVIGGAAAAGGEMYRQAGGSDAYSNRLVRDLLVLAQVGLSGQAGIHGPMTPDVMKPIHDLGAKVEPYVKDGVEPPPGVHQAVDDIHVEQAKADKEALDEALKESVKSTTRERQPDLYAEFAKQHIGENEIGIGVDAVRALYGDKVPEPDDGVLGWVPGIKDQLAAAEATGGDIQVPLADYLARVEPEVHKELADHIRLRPGGLTVEEGKELPPIETFHGSPHSFDAFDINKAGTGEGAQSYGFGHYVAEHPDVASEYANKLSLEDKPYTAAWQIMKMDFVKGDREAAAKSLLSDAGELKPGEMDSFGHSKETLEQAAKLLRSGADLSKDPEPAGNLYSVRIHRRPEEFLDHDKPVNEQSPEHQAILKSLGVVEGDEELFDRGVSQGKKPVSIQTALASLEGKGGQAEVSKKLSEAGIAGIRYLDQGSRSSVTDAQRELPHWNQELVKTVQALDKLRAEGGKKSDIAGLEEELNRINRGIQMVSDRAKSGTSNYVVFNDADLEVVSKNGEALRTVRQAAGLEPKPELPKEAEAESHETHRELKAPFEGPPPGFTKEMYALYTKAIAKRRADDAEWLAARVLKQQRKTQTAEWKANREDMVSQAREEVEAQPVFVLDKMLRDGEIKLNTGPEELELLPREYLTAKGGVDIDDIASMTGYTGTGRSLANELDGLLRTRGDVKPEEFLKETVDNIADRRMEEKYGDLDKNIITEAKDHILSATQEEILHQETLARATEAGQQFPIDPEALRAQVLEFLRNQPLSAATTDKLLRDAGRAGRKSEVAGLKGDAAGAFRESVRRELAFIMAREARKIEKDRASFERRAKVMSARNPDGLPEEFANFAHDVLMRVGMPVKRTRLDLQEQIAQGEYKNLADFVSDRNARGQVDGTAMPIADYILDPKWSKDYKDLTVDEFRDVKNAIDMLWHQGKDEEKVNLGLEKIERREWVKGSVEQMKDQFPIQRYQADPTKWGKTKERVRSYVAAIKNMETFWNRLDKRDRMGRFNKMFSYPGAEAANRKNVLDRQFAQAYKLIDTLKNPRELLDPPFRDPLNDQPWMVFTRKNLEMVIANIGNAGNFKALTEGFKIAPEMLMRWIESVTTPEDIDRAQARWDMLAKAKELHDVVERNVNGYATENVQPTPFTMHGKEYKGGYFPIIDDVDRSPVRHLMGDPEKGPQTFWPTVSTGFTKSRTGAQHVLSLNLDMFPAKLNQVLHAVAFKEFVHNTAKIFRDKEFRNGIRNYYGKEYVEEMDSWLNRVAGNASYNERAIGEVTRISNDLRQNVISTYIAFNPYTIQKHGLSAFVMSGMEEGFGKQISASAEMGVDYFRHAVNDMFGKDPFLGDSLSKFVWDNLEEIQRRDRNWMETVGGQHLLAQGKTSLRNKIAQWGAKGVALSDMLSANPLGLAAYRRAFEETGEVGAARDLANRAVRRAHGSTAITNLPRFVANAGPLTSWMTSLYGFWGTLMQRRIEWAEDIADTYKLAKGAEFTAAAKNVPMITAKTMAYWIWPAMVEEFVTSQFTEDRRGAGEIAIRSLLGGAFSTFLFLREIAYAAQHGRVPSVGGLLQSPVEDATNLVRDVVKKRPTSKQNAGKLIQDSITTFGDFKGKGPKIVGSAARFGHDVARGVQKPKTFGDYFRGITRGDMKERIQR